LHKYEAIRDSIDKLADYKAKKSEEINNENIQESTIAVNTIISVYVIAFILALILGFYISSMIANPIKSILEIVKLVAEGNLAVRKINMESKDEVGILARAVNHMIDNLRSLVEQIIQITDDITASSQQMSASIDQIAQGAQNISNNILLITNGVVNNKNNNNEESLESVGYINKAIQIILAHSEDTAIVSKDTENSAAEGCELAINAISKINQIKTSSIENSKMINELGKLGSEIEVIVDLIKGIAGQTNLLALNAAIEAARAGEHGKGFAVVADEVKTLAGQSAEATDKITEMIKEIQYRTKQAVVAMEEEVNIVNEGVNTIHHIEESLNKILVGSKKTNSNIQDISQEIQKVAKSTDSVSRTMEDISAVTEEQAAGLEQINANTQVLARVSENLKKQTDAFIL